MRVDVLGPVLVAGVGVPGAVRDGRLPWRVPGLLSRFVPAEARWGR
ncbi:hypothetical protein [Lentzea sp. CA-135723]